MKWGRRTRWACRSAGWLVASKKLPFTRASSIRSSLRWNWKRSVSRRDHACVIESRSSWFLISRSRAYCSWNRSSIRPFLQDISFDVRGVHGWSAYRSRTISVHLQHRSKRDLTASCPLRIWPSDPTKFPSFILLFWISFNRSCRSSTSVDENYHHNMSQCF